MVHTASSTPISIAVLTVSDSRSLLNDESGDLIVELLSGVGHSITCREIVKDDPDCISSAISTWTTEPNIEVIIVTGGTGPSPSDCTPEVIVPMFDGHLPGFGELFRQLSFQEVGAASMFSRAEAGWIQGNGIRTPIFLLPGSPNAVSMAMKNLILPQVSHLIDLCRQEQTS